MKRINCFVRIFLLWLLVGIASKVAFLVMYRSIFSDVTLPRQLSVLWYGSRLDLAIAGYCTLIPGLLLLIHIWWQGKALRWLWKGYFLVAAFVVSLAYIANLGLYGYWGFPLDNTPLLYIKTSPADALASMTWWQLCVIPLVILVLTVVIYKMVCPLPEKSDFSPRKRQIFEFVLLLLLEGSLFLPIRGGLGTGTNHTGSVYFSDNIRLNHAAVNPVFCFIESVLHQEEIGTKYRFLPDDEASALFQSLTYTDLRADSVKFDFQPNVILIVLESFSDTIMQMQGVTPNLRKIRDEGLSFPHFYANSFRTDRGLVSIYSGLPAQPTMSVMDIPRKSTTLPSIAGTLSENGYHTVLYYGGDINYSNMRSYFMGTGFRQIVCDSDFPIRLQTGKWGVADGAVYQRLLDDIKADQTDKPFFRSVITGSSHEPFDVPNYQKMDSPVLNAFSYADDCLGKLIDELKTMPCWEKTVVAIVADHLGAFPDNPDNYQPWRFRIPFILTGGAIKMQESRAVIGSQIDIPATILGLLGISHHDFTYSKDLLDPRAPHFAFFTFPDAMGMMTDSSSVFYDNTSHRLHSSTGPIADSLLFKSQAFLQKLYDDLDRR